MTNYHILPRSKGWAIKKEGAKRATKIFSRQDDAVGFANNLGDNVFVHDRRGLIRQISKHNEYKTARRIKSKDRVHVLPYNDRWAVKSENRARVSQLFDSKYRAIRLAHEIAENRGASMVVHKANGEINHIDIPPHFQSPLADFIHMR